MLMKFKKLCFSGTDDSVKLNKRYESSVKTVSPFKNLKESN